MALALPSPSRLPYDVVCMVIDYLWDQRADLASCSLVCRDWLQPCRSHLFRSLRVHSTHADGDFSAFTEFLASPGGQCIRKHVRQLTLQGGPVWLDSQARPRIPLRLLAELINNHLPSLQGLEFRRVRFESDHMDLTSMGTWPRRTIGKLVFHCDSDQLDHFVNILNLLGIFTDISHLEFRAGPLVWRLVPDGVLKNLCWPGPIKVRSFALIGFPKRWTPVALQAIEQSGSLDGTLDTLTVGFQGYADEVEAILPFVHAAAPCIRRLRFNPIPPGLDVTVDVEQLLELFTLPIDTLTNLRSLVLVMYSHDNPTDVAQVVSIIQFRAYILLLQRCVASGLARSWMCGKWITTSRLSWTGMTWIAS
ncbi:hypothetical protein PYCCODRAFT_878073 [Trametes coccinea BRFM310]|uniref:F-box domain-containing protein n=1 Tax=Trametes coccinea (strain BRFM310) TaxID=1353009 RepID=A0A1Y2IG18_TRAC3|nr:hypothetical protein PYCCODRAFT_878073 [Trametes coccinea BRFM310]